MRLEDADIDRDTIGWDVDCDECHQFVRWVGTVKLLGLRVLDDGSLGWAVVRVCRNCASRALLLPERRPIKPDTATSQPFVRDVQLDPHDIDEGIYADTTPELPPPTAA